MDMQTSTVLLIVFVSGLNLSAAKNDEKNCNQSLLIAHMDGIMRYDLTNNLSTPITTDIANVINVDADRNEGLLFFTSWRDDRIYRTNYITHGERILIKNATAHGLSVDHVAKRVFYSYYAIKSIDYDGNDERTHLHDSSEITAIQVDAKSRKIYFSPDDYGVFRCDYDDCANREELYAQHRVIFGMALNAINHLLFWTDFFGGLIGVMSANESQMHILASVYEPYGIARMQDHLYITLWSNGTVIRMNTDGTDVRVMVSRLANPRGLTTICFPNNKPIVTESGDENKLIIVVGLSLFGLLATIGVISLIACVIYRLRNGPTDETPSTPQDTPDYLTPINPPRHRVQNNEMSSEYLTPLRSQPPNEDDAPLYQAPVINRETTANNEYERLNVYETVDL